MYDNKILIKNKNMGGKKKKSGGGGKKKKSAKASVEFLDYNI